MLPLGQDCTSTSTHPWIWLLLVGLNVGDLEGNFVGLGVGDCEGHLVGLEVVFSVVSEIDGSKVVGSLAALVPPLKRFATGDGVIIGSTTRDGVMGVVADIKMATLPKVSLSNDFINVPSSPDVSCNTSIMYTKCKS